MGPVFRTRSSISEDTTMASRLLDKIRINNDLARCMLAEFLGTFVLLTFGDGVVAQVVLSGEKKGTFLSINLGWAMAVLFGVMVSGGVSGGHLNPAVTVTFMLMKKVTFIKGLVYMAAQYAGAFVGSFVVYIIYFDALNEITGGPYTMDTAGVFATYPQKFLSWNGALGDQILGTGLLMMGILAISDSRNMQVPTYLGPFYVALLIFAIGSCFGYNCGYALNPARDLSPRLFTAIAGWGTQVFSYNNYNYFWIPIVGPHCGALLGALIYTLLISNNWPDDSDIDDRFSPTFR